MGVKIGKVTGRELGKNRDGSKKVILLQVEISDPDDVQTVELVDAAGEMSNPPTGSDVVMVSVGSAYKIAVAVGDGIENDLDVGDKQIHATASGAVVSYVKCVNDGQIELNGTGDFGVRFLALEIAFNQLKADHNGHSHAYIPGSGSPTSTAAPAAPSTADISPAKIDTVEVPS